MILSQGSCIYVHASQFNGKHMRPIVEGYPRCVPFFSLRVLRLPFCLPSLAEITSECYLNPFHSPWFQDIQHSSTYVKARVKKNFLLVKPRNVKPHVLQIWIYCARGKKKFEIFFFLLFFFQMFRDYYIKKTHTHTYTHTLYKDVENNGIRRLFNSSIESNEILIRASGFTGWFRLFSSTILSFTSDVFVVRNCK